jgi:chromosome segregation ATPase
MQILKKRQEEKPKYKSPVNQVSSKIKEGNSEPLEKISQLDLLKSLEQINIEFKEFEKIREGIRKRISSITILIPRLKERKDLLQKDIDDKKKEIKQLDRHFPEINHQKTDRLQSISQMQEKKKILEEKIVLEQDKVKEIKSKIVKFTGERKKNEKIIKQKQDEVIKIEGQLKQINSVQEYGVDLVSTLVYASKKR